MSPHRTVTNNYLAFLAKAIVVDMQQVTVKYLQTTFKSKLYSIQFLLAAPLYRLKE